MPEEQRMGSAEASQSTGALMSQLTEDVSTLIRQELQLAQLEMQQKAKRAGLGIGLFGGAGVVAMYAVGALVATAIAALSLALPVWLAALIVTVALFAVAGLGALVGKREISEATPPKPERAIDNLKQDVATIKGADQ